MSSRHEYLKEAKANKNDEFWTQYNDIQREMNAYIEYNPNTFRDKIILLPCDDPEWSNFTRFFLQNFEELGIRTLISTCVNFEGKGKKAIFNRDTFDFEYIDYENIPFEYLEGNGDFRSDEVTQFLKICDMVITNPPFSLFREFISWIKEENKQFMVIGNINCITYKEVFPEIINNSMWLGNGMGRWISGFIVPETYELYGTEAEIDEYGQRIVATNNCLWLTNIDNGRRHTPLPLMTEAENIKFSRHKEVKGIGYKKYETYDAIEVPFTDAIPSDYDGIMGVPITFLDKYCPEQFEILGKFDGGSADNELDLAKPVIDGKAQYKRLAIRRIIK